MSSLSVLIQIKSKPIVKQGVPIFPIARLGFSKSQTKSVCDLEKPIALPVAVSVIAGDAQLQHVGLRQVAANID